MPRTEPTRALSVRLPSDLFVDLEQLARFNQASLAHEVREAVQQHLARQLSDDAFVRKVEDDLEDDLQGLKRLRYRYAAVGGNQPD
jgi:predicted transcriptional regulator